MISFLIPAYNEANSIVETITKLREVMDKESMTYEIIVIDDGSHDDTAALAEGTGVRVVQHPVNGGYGRALKTGIYNATYDWCAIVDADGTYPIESFPALLEHVPQFDMVVGARTGAHYWGSSLKRFSRIMLSQLVTYVVGCEIPDINSGMRIFRKEIALAHIKRISSGFSFTTTITLAMVLDERFVHYVPIEYYEREGKSKVRMGRDSLRMLQILVHAVLYYNPLKLFLPVCVASAGLGLVCLLWDLLFGLTAGLALLAIALLVALVIGALGFVAEVMRQRWLS